MSQYPAQILICVIAYIFQFLKSSVRGLGDLQLWDGPVACLPPLLLQSAKDNEIFQHPLLGGQTAVSAGKITLEELLWIWQNWKMKWIKPLTISRLSIQESSVGSLFFLIYGYFYCISLQSRAWCQHLECNKSQQNVLKHSSLIADKLEFGSLFQTVKHENGEIWKWNVDWEPNLHILGATV